MQDHKTHDILYIIDDKKNAMVGVKPSSLGLEE